MSTKPTKPAIASTKPSGLHQSKHHSMSVECPPKPQNRYKVVVPQIGVKKAAEALRNMIVACKSLQAVMQSEGRKWQLVSDGYPNMQVVQKIEGILREALEEGEDVLVNYLHQKPTVPLFTETPQHRAYMGYEEGVG